MARVLSTRILKPGQKGLLLNAGISVVEYDAIKIELLNFEAKKNNMSNVIFTSKNAVKAVLAKNIQLQDCFCVGNKTASLIEKSGARVVEKAQTAGELAKKIIKSYKNRSFHFFCGSIRRNELPELLKKNDIKIWETKVYRTVMNPQVYDSTFDGVMFFSPSAVRSFTEKNRIESTAFCIGPTTAAEARKHTNKVVIANVPGMENVIAKTVSALRN